MEKLGIVIDKLYVDHDNGMGHPESQERLLAIIDMLRHTKLWEEVVRIEPRDATKEEITLVHEPKYYDFVLSTKGRPRVFLDPDTSTCPVSFDAALRAAGGMLSAVESVLRGEVDTAFPLVRPPGHHAEKNRAMGFCLFNNVAVGAAYLLKSYQFNRILIVDWDLHHGNGTQNMFYHSPQVLYFSTHQYPYYPGTGGINETGIGGGVGYTINVPLPAGMGDGEYMRIFSSILGPVIDQYKPEFILVSAGFDTYFEDPLGGMKVTPKGFAQMTRFLREAAKKHCGGKVVYILEGGYNLDGLWLSTKEVIEELLEKKKTDYGDMSERTKADAIIETVKKVQSPYWEF
ncbi:MAG TPA: histone deacetylase [Thermodesulfobacteriota bacterium]|nr:histone deacetylase [Thermodesulfobacteriota bacterium]